MKKAKQFCPNPPKVVVPAPTPNSANEPLGGVIRMSEEYQKDRTNEPTIESLTAEIEELGRTIRAKQEQLQAKLNQLGLRYKQ